VLGASTSSIRSHESEGSCMCVRSIDQLYKKP
jgi:hypothetical protein